MHQKPHHSSNRYLRPFFLASLLVFGVATTLLATDYLRFVQAIRSIDDADQKTVVQRDADAVVVLTGGAKRISTGVELLKSNHGRRLLISGVSQGTSRTDLGRVLNDRVTMYGCCIDIDRKSLDTRGNAIHTADWVELHGFRKILLVTSNYHMPRSLMLLKEQMPEIDVVGVPIQPPSWEDRTVAQLVFSPIVIREYAKYRIAAFGFEPSVRRITSAFLAKDSKSQS